MRVAAPLLELLPAAAFLLADAAYDSNAFRRSPTERGTVPVIRPNSTRKNVRPFDADRYRHHDPIERAICHLSDWRRVATR